MMKILLVLTLVIGTASMAQAQKPKPKTKPAPAASSAALSGIYEGNLLIPGGGKLRLVLHFDGKGGGTWDSPEQGAFGLKLSKTTLTKETVKIGRASCRERV